MANWTQITLDLKVPEDNGVKSIASPWLLALAVIDDCDHLRIEADGEWQLLPGLDVKCGPDGRGDIPIADTGLILPACPPGALIGKIGGSSAAIEQRPDDADAAAVLPALFAIGKTCMVPLEKMPHGPLFIGINIALRPLTIDRIELKIFGATIG